MSGLELEPAVLCLLASLIWAPIVYLVAGRMDRGRPLSASELLWLGALAVAALPTLVAPALAAAGISLRAAAPTEYGAAYSSPPTTQVVEISTLAVESPGIENVVHTPQQIEIEAFAADSLIRAAGLLYFYGVLLFLGQWLVRTLIFAIKVGAATPVDYPGLAPALQAWRRRLGVSAKLRLRKSPAVSSVCVYGIFRPIILIPAELDARISLDDLVMMCAHELAHVKRGDARLFSVLTATRIFFWFNPFVKRIAARAELAAEQSADALILERGADRRAYAACFVEGLRFAAEKAQRAMVAVPSFTPFDRRSRRMRLDAILSGAAAEARSPSRLTAGGAVLCAGLLAVAQAAFAVQPARDLPDVPKFERLPVDGPVTLDYGKAFVDKATGAGKTHQGVDIKASVGTDIVAPADGVVILAADEDRDHPNWGKIVVIEHGGGVVSRYAHLSAYVVKPGDRVRAGDKIAEVGDTGDVSGPHLHFEVSRAGETVDPIALLDIAPPRALRAPAPRIAAAPAPESAPAPAAAPSPMAPPGIATAALDEELAGKAAAPEAPTPVAPTEPLKPFVIMRKQIDIKPFKDRDFRAFSFSDGEQRAFAAGGGPVRFSFGDGGVLVLGEHIEMSPEDRARFEKSLDRMRAEIRAAQADHAKAMKELKQRWNSEKGPQKSWYAFRVDAERAAEEWLLKNEEELERLSELAAEEWLSEHEEELEREMERAEREMERAERERERAEREREREMERADRERERMLDEAERARELAEEEAERARDLAMDRDMQLEMLARQAEALAEAERSIKEQRAHIEKLRKELENERARSSDGA